MFIYKDSKFTEMIPDDFSISGDWDLLCYYQKTEGYMFVGFVNKHLILYSYKISDNKWEKISKFDDGLYDFKWVTEPINSHEYPMKAIVLKNNIITLKGLLFTIVGTKSQITVEEKLEKQFTKIKSYSNSFFNRDKQHFYFITYNNVTDFTSGFYNKNDEFSFDSIDTIEPTINDISPLEFFNDVEVIYIKFIQNTPYLYYKIKNNENNAIYYGIIDIEENKVVFNTDEELIEFKPYSSNSMLAITANSAYKICVIQDSGECIGTCSSGKVVHDTQKPNQCSSEIQCENYLLMNNEICVESCDENIFTSNEKICGLCKDLYEDKPYKLLNTTGCLSKDEIPENTEFANERLYLLRCKETYNLKDGKCIPPCYELCQTCDVYSDDINNQNCTSCKNESHVLQDGNCIDECKEGYYESEKKCLKCGEFCKTCENSEKCSICYDGYYLDEKVCKKCSENCETCTRGPEENGNQNCLSCKQDSIYKYLINEENNHTCVDNCPESTFLDDINKICEKCTEFCLTCENKEKCELCYYGYYLDQNICKKCSENCETCSKGPEENGNQNCITCNLNSIYKYLMNDKSNSTCVDNCPKNTYLEQSNQTCIYKNITVPKKKSKKWLIFWIILIIILILIIIIIYLYIRNKKKRISSEQIEQVNNNQEKSLH